MTKILKVFLILSLTFGFVLAKNRYDSTSNIRSYLHQVSPFNSTLPSFLNKFANGLRASSSSLFTTGNLGIMGITLLGSLALFSPLFFGETKRNEYNFDTYPEFGRKVFNSFRDLSMEAVPLIENEIIQAHQMYKRSKRSGDERLSLHDFVSTRFMSLSESIMVWVERTLDNLPHLPRLEAQSCMKRVICEAHNQPKKYGLSGLLLQLFFPPYVENDTPNKIISKYQLAARYGRTENANCAVQYDDCIINFLDLVQGLANLIL